MTEGSRFLLFGGDRYYPRGGARDLISAHDTLDDAAAALPERPADLPGSRGGYGSQWAHVFDVSEWRVVRAWEASYGPRISDEKLPGIEPSHWETEATPA